MSPLALAAAAPFLALAGALVNGLFGRRLREPLPGWIATAAVGAAFVVSLVSFVAAGGEPSGTRVVLWEWLHAGGLEIDLAFRVDRLSALFLMVVTGVGTLIHLYSVGYMHGDRDFSRYFALLNLFVAAMLVLVLADSYPLMFVGWEGVGVCSYGLIGFWYERRPNVDAARKAFIVNRVGDVGFLLAMFLIAATFGTLQINEVNEAAAATRYGAPVLTVIGLLLLVAAAGKSAQLPLQVWLPDAMAGPTPVSALIHAATMVTAGVYLVARSAPLFAQAPDASAAVAWVGGLTALVAAFSALAQTDIKKILAYSTISQLGFMFAAVGAGAYAAGIFHVFTHAFFKALLFLAAGSAIHALGGEQDVRRMGGLRKRMPVTAATALIGTLAIAGVPLLAGFFSKDAVLAGVATSILIEHAASPLLYSVLLVTAALTAFYMGRWYLLVFEGPERLSEEAAAHAHESPAVMTVPLAVLAFFSIFAGWLGLPAFLAGDSPVFRWIDHWLEPSLLPGELALDVIHPSVALEWGLIGLSILAAAVGLGLAWWMYVARKGEPARRLGALPLAGLSRSGVGFDALYGLAVRRPAEGAAEGLAGADREIVDRGLRGAAGGVAPLSRAVALLQSGYARLYALAMAVGVLALVLLVLITGVRS